MADPESPPAVPDGPISFVVTEELAGSRADFGLAALCAVPRSQVRRWIEAGRVQLDGELLLRPSRKLVLGSRIEAIPPAPIELEVLAEPIPVDVLHEDRDLIVINKPAGLVCHPAPGHWTGTLVNALLHHCDDLAGVGGAIRPGIVHRLDRGTSGVMVAAKNDAAHAALSLQFQNHTIHRTYHALCRAAPRADQGRVDRPIGRHVRDRKRMSVRTRSGRRAVTAWRVVERFPEVGVAWLEVKPETGRTHQIRVHLSAIGLPLLGDDVYGRAHRDRSRRLPLLKRPALHAASLGFVHPSTGDSMVFESAWPEDLLAALASLRGDRGSA